VIEGTLPNDTYDKETIYWVPMEGEHPKPVDSTYVNKNKFRLVISPHNLNKMGIVRVKPHLRFDLQDILVFTEKGIVKVNLDTVSSSSGTPLNNEMQIWKDRKRTCDKEVYYLTREMRKTDLAEKDIIEEEIKKIYAAYYDDLFRIIIENKENEVGKFIYSLNKSVFTQEQIEKLDID
jgi:hypothetical protein